MTEELTFSISVYHTTPTLKTTIFTVITVLEKL
jgi:hypothetical protein